MEIALVELDFVARMLSAAAVSRDSVDEALLGSMDDVVEELLSRRFATKWPDRTEQS